MDKRRLEMNRHPGIVAGKSRPGLALAAGVSLAAHMGLLATLLHGLADGSLPAQLLETYVVDIVIEDSPLGASGLGAAQALKKLTLKAQQSSPPSRKVAEPGNQKDVPAIEVAAPEFSAISKPLPKREKTFAEIQAAPRSLVATMERDGSSDLATPLPQKSEVAAIPQAAIAPQKKESPPIRPRSPPLERAAGKQMELPQPDTGRDAATPDITTAALLPRQGPDTLRQPTPEKSVSYTTGRTGNAPPEYPKRARRRGYEGRVVVRAFVTPLGRVNSTELVQSSGHDILDRVAIRAVRRWRFKPAMQGGKPIFGTIDVPISFRLNRHTI